MPVMSHRRHAGPIRTHYSSFGERQAAQWKCSVSRKLLGSYLSWNFLSLRSVSDGGEAVPDPGLPERRRPVHPSVQGGNASSSLTSLPFTHTQESQIKSKIKTLSSTLKVVSSPVSPQENNCNVHFCSTVQQCSRINEIQNLNNEIHLDI